ncbi:MAG: penicillin acylase family protein [Thermoplasmata archaeon]|nr:penicillin acylase family protein [Thermoplasmata archaeon]
MKKIFVAILVALILIFSIFSMNFTILNPVNGVWNETLSSNYTSNTIRIPGLINNVTIKIDSSGMAHIFASNDHDLFFAEGYYQASNRLFQMEMQALAASGNLSKYLGPSYVGSDNAMRYLGLPYNAYKLEQAYKENEPEYYDLVIAFSNGINAYINSTGTPFYFKLAGFSPFPWSPYYTLVWEEYMTLSLTTGIYEPLYSSLFYNKFGFYNSTLIWPYYPYYTDKITVIPGDGTVNGNNLEKQHINPDYLWSLNWYESWATGINTTFLKNLTPLIMSALKNISDPMMLPELHAMQESIGSNSWVVTSNHSVNGHPMLANDPHLTLLAPSLWIPLQLNDPNYNVTGWALAGIPGILIGHTQNTSWGLTMSEGNSANIFLEIFKGNNYLYNNTWYPLTYRNYTLQGKEYSIPVTRNGPVLARVGNFGLSLNWTAATPSYVLIAELKLDSSKNYTDMVNALRYWGYPPQNFALVSKDHAGYIVAGNFPIIRETLPNGEIVSVVGSRSILNGTLPEYTPYGNVPFEYLPQVVDPDVGYAFAPNQATVGRAYPYPFIGGFWDSGGRAYAAYHYLSTHTMMSIDDMKAMQSNLTDFWAMKLVPYIINGLSNMQMDQVERNALDYLESWNFTTFTDSVGITIYWYTLSYIYNLSFQKIQDINGLSMLPLPFVNTLIYLASNYPNSPWLNGNFTSLVQESFSKAVSLLESKLGNNVSSWTWGRVHFLLIESITGSSAFSIGPIPFYGDDNTLSVGSVPYTPIVPLPYVTASSSLREISSPGAGIFLGVFPGGPSDNPLSYYYKNQLNTWISHEYYDLTKWNTEVVITYE